MTERELYLSLKTNYPKETASCEWKEFKNLRHVVKGHEGDDIISYISAIANVEGGQLIIGVEDNTLNIVGIEDYHTYSSENIILKILEQTPNLSSEGFRVESLTTTDSQKTIWIFHIPKHQPRKPVLAHNKPWQRVENNLVHMRPEREQAILDEPFRTFDDWSAEICLDATIDDLSLEAILKAKQNFLSKFPQYGEEGEQWDHSTFLNKAKLFIKGKVTKSAILLLGKPESEHFLRPSIARIRWILKDKNSSEKDYLVLSCPFLLSAEEIYRKIRKIKYRYMRDDTLFPEEVDQYEPYVIREAINNCIAHQDYNQCGYINVVENEDGFLVFSNLGNFIPKSIENVIRENAPEEQYRNPFLANAMFNLKMVDTIGSGIRRMFNYQRQRFFPLPDYDIRDNKVSVTITGKVLDMAYAEVLSRNPDLSLEEIIMLDKFQKRLPLSSEELKILCKKKLIEGRKPNFYITSSIATTPGDKAGYIKNRAFDDSHYKKLIVAYLQKYKTGTRNDFETLLMDKLSDVLSIEQKKDKVKNILQAMRLANTIFLEGKFWKLS